MKIDDPIEARLIERSVPLGACLTRRQAIQQQLTTLDTRLAGAERQQAEQQRNLDTKAAGEWVQRLQQSAFGKLDIAEHPVEPALIQRIATKADREEVLRGLRALRHIMEKADERLAQAICTEMDRHRQSLEESCQRLQTELGEVVAVLQRQAEAAVAQSGLTARESIEAQSAEALARLQARCEQTEAALTATGAEACATMARRETEADANIQATLASTSMAFDVKLAEATERANAFVAKIETLRTALHEQCAAWQSACEANWQAAACEVAAKAAGAAAEFAAGQAAALAQLTAAGRQRRDELRHIAAEVSRVRDALREEVPTPLQPHHRRWATFWGRLCWLFGGPDTAAAAGPDRVRPERPTAAAAAAGGAPDNARQAAPVPAATGQPPTPAAPPCRPATGQPPKST